MTNVDELITRLNESGVPFTRDVWIDDDNLLNDQDYGIVELGGTVKQLWGDGILLEQTMVGNVVLYVMDGNEEKVRAVQDILRELEISFFPSEVGTYVETENKNRWTWAFELEVYLLQEDD